MSGHAISALAQGSSSPGSMRRCAECGRVFDGDEAFCPFDAHALEPWEPDDPLVGRVLADRYRILRPLGRGGMGVVYEAEQHLIERRVAIKVLRGDRAQNPRALKRFRREARAIGKLRSPHVVTVFEFGQTEDGLLYLVMELLEGRTLGTLLSNRGRLELSEAAPILDQIARGLEDAHAQGLIHRDIKPDNMFLCRSADYTQFVKILDFGVAATLEPDASDDAQLTGTGEIPGTPNYLAPERITGEAFDARVDVYALGVMMYEMLAGQLPFQRAGSWDVLVAHLQQEPTPLQEACPQADVPDPVVAFLWRCLAKNPAARPADAREFRLGLLEALAVTDNANWSYDTGLVAPTTDVPAGPLPSIDLEAGPPPRRTLWVGIGAAMVASAAIGYLVAGSGASWDTGAAALVVPVPPSVRLTATAAEAGRSSAAAAAPRSAATLEADVKGASRLLDVQETAPGAERRAASEAGAQGHKIAEMADTAGSSDTTRQGPDALEARAPGEANGPGAVRKKARKRPKKRLGDKVGAPEPAPPVEKTEGAKVPGSDRVRKIDKFLMPKADNP